MSLTEGYKRAERIPTRNVCVDRGYKVEKIGKVSAFAFEHREEAEFDNKFKVGGELGFKIEDFKAKVKAKIVSDSGQSLSIRHSRITLIFDATSVAEQAETNDNGVTGTFCKPNGTVGPRNMAEFYDRCGDSYLERQEYGGHYSLTWDLTTLTDRQKTDLKAVLQLDVGDYTVGTDYASLLSAAYSITTQSVTFEFDGLPVPTLYGVIEPGGKVNVQRFADHLAKLDHTWGLNAGNNDIAHPANGVRLKQKFVPYTYTDFINCNSDFQVFYQPDLSTGFTCRDELAGHFASVQAPGTPLAARIELRQSYLNPSPGLAPLLRWPREEVANQQRMAAWVKSAVECRDVVWPARWTACDKAFRAQARAAENGGTADWNSACDACKLPTSCLYNELFSRFVPEPSVTTVEEPDYAFGAVSQNGAGQVELNQFDTHLCTLAGVHGALRGGQEFVFLEGGNAHYQLIAQSGRTDPAEEVGGTSVCIDRSRFFNAYAQDFFGPPTQGLSFSDLDIVGPTGTTASTSSVGQAGSFTSLAGIGGRFEDRTTTTFISQQPNASSAGSLSFRITNSLPNQYLKARVMSDGLRLRPGRNTQELSGEVFIQTPAPASLGDGVAFTTQTRVGDSQTEFCFLTSISGEFRTSEDAISLRVDGSSWVLRWSASAPFLAPFRTKSVSARCVKYDQR